MATVSASNVVLSPNKPRSISPPLKGLKKVFSGRRRSSEAKSEDSASVRRSVESLNLDRSTTISSTRSSPSREDAHRTSFSGVHKLIPGHSKRERQRAREAELKAIMDEEPLQRGRTPDNATIPPPGAMNHVNRSTASLLTDGSENDTPPPLMTRDSHKGYFTTSSPLITIKTIDEHSDAAANRADTAIATPLETFPVILEPEPEPEPVPEPEHHEIDKRSPKSSKLDLKSPSPLQSPIFGPALGTLQPEHATEKRERRGSISRLRGKSPARKIRDAFSRPGKSPRSSPERESTIPYIPSTSSTHSQATLAERRFIDNQEKAPPAPLKSISHTQNATLIAPNSPLTLHTDIAPPKTPPSGRLATPLTTVTPPTPTDIFRDGIVASPKMVEDSDAETSNSDKNAILNGNNLTHRRVRSGSSNTHQKSKLSTSMIAPLTPAVEDDNKATSEKVGGGGGGGRNFTAGSGFFSSWMSAAQNAATSITNLTGQNRSRAGTSNSEPVKARVGDEGEEQEEDVADGDVGKKQLAVETLGSGNLDFSQLGIDMSAEHKIGSPSRADLSGLRKKSDLQRDEAQAKVEDILAKRAVSAAYEDPGDSTPVAEISDPVANLKHTQTHDSMNLGTLTPPNGSIKDVDGQPVKRSSSVRSKLGKRRSRGSSVATGQSTISTTLGSTPVLAVNVSAGVRPTGFTPAPKQRNRGFHQQFRSVPDDDSLIEDYSCALQKEILLAGRIYISEGHICFSSNILGWVTTLIISFEEIVSIERENTAMIIPNAIAIQTLHARHTFRSLLSREATFDLMIAIWKHNHPASFLKSVNGKQLVAEQAQHDAEKALGTAADEHVESDGTSGEESGSDEDDHDDGRVSSAAGSTASIAGSEFLDTKSLTRQPSGTNGGQTITNGGPTTSTSAPVNEAIPATVPAVATPTTSVDFPGPVAHTPTDCNDSTTHYDKIIKDEVIPAPLGKVYSLLYGPQSGVFVRKYLVDECKCLDLVLDDDKKGITNENKSRQYSYIKPLGGSIGPKQTKCITTENLDFFDLEKSVSVTCTTQTPDVPSGSAFSTKTRYCLSWAPGNATRLQMNCTIEWTAKSWLKGPIEKGANDGQQQYGDGLVKSLKAALGRARAGTGSKVVTKPKKKKKGDRKSRSEHKEETTQQNKNWGVLEPFRTTLEPVVDITRPFARMEVALGILAIMVIILWFGGNRRGSHISSSGSSLNHLERLVAYDQLWQKEESELWDWLEDRAGVHRIVLGEQSGNSASGSSRKATKNTKQKSLKDKSMTARLQAEKWSRKEMQEAVRVTRERLDDMQRILDKRTI